MFVVMSALWTRHVVAPRAPGWPRAVAAAPLLPCTLLLPFVLFPGGREQPQQRLAYMFSYLFLGLNTCKARGRLSRPRKGPPAALRLCSRTQRRACLLAPAASLQGARPACRAAPLSRATLRRSWHSACSAGPWRCCSRTAARGSSTAPPCCPWRWWTVRWRADIGGQRGRATCPLSRASLGGVCGQQRRDGRSKKKHGHRGAGGGGWRAGQFPAC